MGWTNIVKRRLVARGMYGARVDMRDNNEWRAVVNA